MSRARRSSRNGLSAIRRSSSGTASSYRPYWSSSSTRSSSSASRSASSRADSSAANAWYRNSASGSPRNRAIASRSSCHRARRSPDPATAATASTRRMSSSSPSSSRKRYPGGSVSIRSAPEGLPQSGHVTLKRSLRCRRRPSVPEPFHELVRGDGSVRVKQQKGKERPALRAGGRDVDPVRSRLEPAEQPEVHLVLIVARRRRAALAPR